MKIQLLPVPLAALLLRSGCDHAPSLDVMGSFFPAWMTCLTAGVVLILPVRRLLLSLGWEPNPRSEAVVYPALLVTFSCLLWLLLFR
jgi:hypothetical protein